MNIIKDDLNKKGKDRYINNIGITRAPIYKILSHQEGIYYNGTYVGRSLKNENEVLSETFEVPLYDLIYDNEFLDKMIANFENAGCYSMMIITKSGKDTSYNTDRSSITKGIIKTGFFGLREKIE